MNDDFPQKEDILISRTEKGVEMINALKGSHKCSPPLQEYNEFGKINSFSWRFYLEFIIDIQLLAGSPYDACDMCTTSHIHIYVP